jgi:hypothetical protein
MEEWCKVHYENGLVSWDKQPENDLATLLANLRITCQQDHLIRIEDWQ